MDILRRRAVADRLGDLAGRIAGAGHIGRRISSEFEKRLPLFLAMTVPIHAPRVLRSARREKRPACSSKAGAAPPALP